jgi:PadR family transcriptional regulator PadR
MVKSTSLSEYELMVLLAILRIGKAAYGVPIAREIEEQTGKAVALSGTYAALDRLKAQGLVAAQRGEATAERGGRAKTYFTVTARGLRQVHEMQQRLVRMWEGLPGLS